MPSRLLDVEAITPTVDEVAEHIAIRTRNRHSRQVDTFNDETRPNGDQAAKIAMRAARYVVLRVGRPSVDTDEAELVEIARDVAALYAALIIETSFYGDGNEVDESRADQLGRMFREQLRALIAAARDNRTGGTRIHSIMQTTEAGLAAALPQPYATGLSDLLPEQIANTPESRLTP